MLQAFSKLMDIPDRTSSSLRVYWTKKTGLYAGTFLKQV
jgi:hypothetical protein